MDNFVENVLSSIGKRYATQVYSDNRVRQAKVTVDTGGEIDPSVLDAMCEPLHYEHSESQRPFTAPFTRYVLPGYASERAKLKHLGNVSRFYVYMKSGDPVAVSVYICKRMLNIEYLMPFTHPKKI